MIEAQERSSDLVAIYDGLEVLRMMVELRQINAGYPCAFRVGDLVRFPLGVSWNKGNDYRVKQLYNNGLSVESTDGNAYVQEFLDEAVVRLGMCHSPNHKEE